MSALVILAFFLLLAALTPLFGADSRESRSSHQQTALR